MVKPLHCVQPVWNQSKKTVPLGKDDFDIHRVFGSLPIRTTKIGLVKLDEYLDEAVAFEIS